MCQLCRNLHPTVAPRWQRPLPLQRLWALLQDERNQQATRQTKEENGEHSLKVVAFVSAAKMAMKRENEATPFSLSRYFSVLEYMAMTNSNERV